MPSFGLASSCARGALSRACNSTKVALAASSHAQVLASRRTFSSLPNLRPSIFPTSPLFRPANSTLSRVSTAPSTLASSTEGVVLDLVPKTAITSHPSLSGAASQIRCGPRPTMARTSRLVRKRRHGFLSRIRTKNGRKTLQRRREKKRSMLSN
ncbi:hypothetical protein F4778DRAFT_730477 [Xylariomycetidae sp. FL2044]|nr:hypothetical protein F4778DRAFT_730477 [Xylariomycetidae sp. FL2044]